MFPHVLHYNKCKTQTQSNLISLFFNVATLLEAWTWAGNSLGRTKVKPILTKLLAANIILSIFHFLQCTLTKVVETYLGHSWLIKTLCALQSVWHKPRYLRAVECWPILSFCCVLSNCLTQEMGQYCAIKQATFTKIQPMVENQSFQD